MGKINKFVFWEFFEHKADGKRLLILCNWGTFEIKVPEISNY